LARQEQQQQQQQQQQQEQERMEQEASSQPPLAGDSAFSYWPPQLLLLLLLLLLPSGQWQRCCFFPSTAPAPSAAFFLRVPGSGAGAFSSPTGGGARLAERPLRFGPYSRALTTATAPPASIRHSPQAKWRMAGWRRRVARLGLGLGCCPRSSTCCCCRCCCC
jgi:hypothetical protein